MCNLLYSEKLIILRIVLALMDVLDSVCLVLKAATFLLTDIIAVLSWPKNWTIENVSTHFVSSLFPLVAPTFRQNTAPSGSAGA
jgi:hypothetical protein